MEILGIYIYGHVKVERRWTKITGCFLEGQLKAAELEVAGDWPARPGWMVEDIDRDTFAAVYYDLDQIRKKFPHLVVWIQRGKAAVGVDGPAALQEHVFVRYPSVAVVTPFAILLDGEFHDPGVWKFDAYLFNVGTGPFLDFAGGMFNPKSGYHAALFFSKDQLDLSAMKAAIESSRQPDHVWSRITSNLGVDVFFSLNEEWDFSLMTRDSEVSYAFLRNPKFDELAEGRSVSSPP